jgi:cyclopropane-fatty-acyl-phospholipid synthase
VAQRARYARWVDELGRSPIAVDMATANTQHYEVPAAFFRHVLGRHLKYSCAYWPPGVTTLDEAEDAMLTLSAERAGLADGQAVLDLGCGWGSMTLWIAERHPASAVTAVSNSRSQAEFIRAQCGQRGLTNVVVTTADVSTYEPSRRFDRVVSIEMFEHLRNYGAMLARVAGWLERDGEMFLHIFSHRDCAYPYEDRGPTDWMARHFFTGGMMPSDGLLAEFQDDLTIDAHWQLDGTHYARTADAWLGRMDANRDRIMPIFHQTYGEHADRFWSYWRIFFLAVSEMFGHAGGREWIVSQYRLAPEALRARARG